MTRTRREFLAATSALAAHVTGRPSRDRSTRGTEGRRSFRNPHDDPDPHALAACAVDAARAAGAAYADARLTVTRQQWFFGPKPVQESELFGIGVRALVNGYWGFASSAVWTADEAVRLGRGVVDQARANAMGKTRALHLGVVPSVVQGRWTMPVKYDPFDVPVAEKMDFMNDAVAYARSLREGMPLGTQMHFRRQTRVYASSEGSSWEQTVYHTRGGFTLGYRDQASRGLPIGSTAADFLSYAGKGWEHIAESDLVDRIPALIENAEQSRYRVPVTVGRYDVVFSAQAMAVLLDATIGVATELDRALGYEADAGGTSYLGDPLAMLGSYQVGSALLNVVADRSTPGAAATVRWDDESIAPEPFSIVTNGMLVDYQTTREQAAWLAPYYRSVGLPVRSHGCAGAESGLTVTMQHAPNLRFLPGRRDLGFDALVAGVKTGLAVLHVEVAMDQQQLNGMVFPLMRQITNGKLGAFVTNGGLMLRSPELWRSLTAIGGASSERWFGVERGKGQPWQQTVHSVGAVPGLVENVRVVDVTRRG